MEDGEPGAGVPAPPAVREPGQFCRLGESPLDGLMSEIRLD